MPHFPNPKKQSNKVFYNHETHKAYEAKSSYALALLAKQDPCFTARSSATTQDELLIFSRNAKSFHEAIACLVDATNINTNPTGLDAKIFEQHLQNIEFFIEDGLTQELKDWLAAEANGWAKFQAKSWRNDYPAQPDDASHSRRENRTYEDAFYLIENGVILKPLFN